MEECAIEETKYGEGGASTAAFFLYLYICFFCLMIVEWKDHNML